jgi:hypothetical protein
MKPGFEYGLSSCAFSDRVIRGLGACGIGASAISKVGGFGGDAIAVIIWTASQRRCITKRTISNSTVMCLPTQTVTDRQFVQTSVKYLQADGDCQGISVSPIGICSVGKKDNGLGKSCKSKLRRMVRKAAHRENTTTRVTNPRNTLTEAQSSQTC